MTAWWTHAILCNRTYIYVYDMEIVLFPELICQVVVPPTFAGG